MLKDPAWVLESVFRLATTNNTKSDYIALRKIFTGTLSPSSTRKAPLRLFQECWISSLDQMCSVGCNKGLERFTCRKEFLFMSMHSHLT